jgi:hypothetical protein
MLASSNYAIAPLTLSVSAIVVALHVSMLKLKVVLLVYVSRCAIILG